MPKQLNKLCYLNDLFDRIIFHGLEIIYMHTYFIYVRILNNSNHFSIHSRFKGLRFYNVERHNVIIERQHQHVACHHSLGAVMKFINGYSEILEWFGFNRIDAYCTLHKISWELSKQCSSSIFYYFRDVCIIKCY